MSHMVTKHQTWSCMFLLEITQETQNKSNRSWLDNRDQMLEMQIINNRSWF